MEQASHPGPGDRWVVITGASSGIGLELARVFAAQGFHALLVARSGDALRALAAELMTKHAVKVAWCAADLSQAAGVDAVVTAWERLGVVPEVLVNNAGFGSFGSYLSLSPLDEQGMIDLNISALTRLVRQVLPSMVTRGHGRVLNVASTAAFQPGPLMAVYYATKAYVLSYSEALAEELRGTGVTVTTLCPGPTASEFQARAGMQASALVQGRSLPSSRDVAELGVKACLAGQRVVIHGTMNQLLAFSGRFTPRSVMTRVVARLMRSRV